MTGLSQFSLAVLLLLVAPGPTNTLLLTAASTNGFRRALSLLAAEALGYLVTIHLVIFSKGFLGEPLPATKVAIRIACSLYLIYLAYQLWVENLAKPAAQHRIRFFDVLVTTLVNPKGFILALAIVPYRFDTGWRFVVPYLACMQATILGAGLGWISLGSLLKSGVVVSVPTKIVRRTGSVALASFAVLISSAH